MGPSAVRSVLLTSHAKYRGQPAFGILGRRDDTNVQDLACCIENGIDMRQEWKGTPLRA